MKGRDDMGLLSTEVEVKVNTANYRHYKSLGYEMPTRINNKGKEKIDFGRTILVKVNDLMHNSHFYVDVCCDCCGKEYSLQYYNYVNKNHDGLTYCHKCSLKVLNSGELNYLWDKNRSKEERERGRNIEGYTDFIKGVLSRDNYTCQCCGKSNCRLEVHHLDGYDWCVEKRIDTTNGISLCKDCHKNFHYLYGKGGNTKEQFEKWIGKVFNYLEKYDGVLPTARMIYCVEDDEIYSGVHAFCKEKNIKSTAPIYSICNHSIRKRGNSIIHNYTYKGKHYFWYDEYINMSQEELEEHLSKGGRQRRVS